jgi:hypothetical protein
MSESARLPEAGALGVPTKNASSQKDFPEVFGADQLIFKRSCFSF